MATTETETSAIETRTTEIKKQRVKATPLDGIWLRLDAADGVQWLSQHENTTQQEDSLYTGYLLSVAVHPRGQRNAGMLCASDEVWQKINAIQKTKNIVVVLDHAGIVAAWGNPERPFSLSKTPEMWSERKPQRLTDAEIEIIQQAYIDAAAQCARFEIPVILAIDDDHFLQQMASPRFVDEERREKDSRARIAQVTQWYRVVLDGYHRIQTEKQQKKTAIPVAVCIEELCPGGYDPTDGVVLTQSVCQVAKEMCGQEMPYLLATGGSFALPALRIRNKGVFVDDDDWWQASAAWLLGRVAVPVLACGPSVHPQVSQERAVAIGLSGMVHHNIRPDTLDAFFSTAPKRTTSFESRNDDT